MTNKIYGDISSTAVLKAISRDKEYGLSLMNFKDQKIFTDLDTDSDKMLHLRSVIWQLIEDGLTEYKVNYVSWRSVITDKGKSLLGMN